MTAAFDRATAVAAAAAPAGDAAHTVHRITVDPGWTIGGRPNGGYLLATMARAALAAVADVEGPPHPHPVTASAHYLSSPDPGPAEVHVEVLRRGRRMSHARARLVRDGAACVEAMFTLGRHDGTAEPWWTDAPVAAMPPRDECVRVTGVGPSGVSLPIMELVDIRLDPAVTGFSRGEPAGRGELRGWLAFADGRAADPLSLVFALDALPPATFDLAPTGWVPTLELTTYVRAVPARGPLRVRQRARLVEADLFDEVCDVWDSRGRLVAQGTQLAGIRVGDAPAPPSVH